MYKTQTFSTGRGTSMQTKFIGPYSICALLGHNKAEIRHLHNNSSRIVHLNFLTHINGSEYMPLHVPPNKNEALDILKKPDHQIRYNLRKRK